MNWEAVSAIAVVLSVAISIIALFIARKANMDNSHLTIREAEYLRLLIAKEQREHQNNERTVVSARLYKSGKSEWKLRVFNRGPAEARNIRIELLEEASFFDPQWVSKKFPMPRMESGQSVDLLAFVHLGSHSKEDLRLIWDDQSGTNRSQTVTVTI